MYIADAMSSDAGQPLLPTVAEVFISNTALMLSAPQLPSWRCSLVYFMAISNREISPAPAADFLLHLQWRRNEFPYPYISIPTCSEQLEARRRRRWRPRNAAAAAYVLEIRGFGFWVLVEEMYMKQGSRSRWWWWVFSLRRFY